MSVRDILQSAAGASGPSQAFIITNNNSPYINAYRYTGAGFDLKYANPSPAFTDNPVGVGFSRSNAAVVTGGPAGSGALVAAYAWSFASGFGTKYANPSTLPANGPYIGGSSAKFSPSNNAVMWAGGLLPIAYAWSDSTGFGAKYADPSPAPFASYITTCLDISPGNDAVVLGGGVGTYIAAYAWSDSTGFGAKYANPSPLPDNEVRGVAFSPANNAVHVVHRGGTYMKAYGWNASTGFGTSYSVPGLPRVGSSVAFHPSGNIVSYGFETSPPRVSSFPWSISTGFGVRLNQSGPNFPPNVIYSIAFSAAGDAIAVSSDQSPFVASYPFSGTTGVIGTTAFNFPGASPSGVSYSCAFSN
jgi:hypothetical protein